MIMRSFCFLLTEVRDLPTYDGLSEVDTFLKKFEREVPGQQCFEALNGYCALRPQNGRARTKEALRIGANVGK